jgi:acetoin utilization protein AcuB
MQSKLYTIADDAPLSEALKTMVTNSIHRLPVTNTAGKNIIALECSNPSGDLVGIVTDRDLRLAADSPFLFEPAEKGIDSIVSLTSVVWDHLAKHKVSDCMHKSLVTIEENTPIVDAAKLMRVSNVGGLPVLTEQGKLVGVVTRTDLLDQLIRIYEPLTTTRK